MSNWPDDDKTIHQALMEFLRKATFELKGKEVVPFSKVFMWAENIPHNYDKKVEKKRKRTHGHHK